jgi:hypothetical protein
VLELKQISDEFSVPSDEDIAALASWTDMNVGGPSESGKPTWYQLLRETQGNPDAILTSGYIIDNRSFGEDSLFCEWAYVIDFDAQRLDVYVGFQTKPPTAGWWAEHGEYERQGEYYPVNRVCSYPLSALPSAEEFTSEAERVADEDKGRADIA